MGKSHDHLPEDVARAYPDFVHMTDIYTEELETALVESRGFEGSSGDSVVNAVKRAKERLDNEWLAARNENGQATGESVDV